MNILYTCNEHCMTIPSDKHYMHTPQQQNRCGHFLIQLKTLICISKYITNASKSVHIVNASTKIK